MTYLDEESCTRCLTIDCSMLQEIISAPYASLSSMRRTDYRALHVRAENAVQKPNHIFQCIVHIISISVTVVILET